MDADRRGRREFDALIGGTPEDLLPELLRGAPHLFESLMAGFSGFLSRPELGRADREIATVAMLAALGDTSGQLAVHTRAALRQGIRAHELLALCEHVTGYAGFPRALNAFAVINRIIDEEGITRPRSLRRVRVTDHETVVASYGEAGPPVVFAHAIGLDWRMWEPVLGPLSTGRRLFAYDVRGHGAAAGSPTPFTMADTGRDLIALLDTLELDRVHAVGLSYGGGVVQAAAALAPERFASLSLLATTDRPFDAFADRARAAENDGMAAQLADTLTRWFTPAGLAVDDWGVRYARERVLRADVTDWAEAWRSFTRFDVEGKLTGLAGSTLVLAGGADVSTTPEIMSGIAERLPGSRFQVLPGAPHMLTLERPDLVAEALEEFLPAEQG